jgi:soluble lytic murein transglycosylase-like protein
MQVLPETASRFSVHNLDDPRQNLQAGVLYLKHLIDLFDGNVMMAVAAYNAGPNQVRRHRGVPPYKETRRYLGKVMGLRQAYADQLRRS